MSQIAYYHHPEDSHLSLDYVAYDLATAEEQIDSLKEDEFGRIEEYNFDHLVYLVYRGTTSADTADDLEFDIVSAVEELEWENKIITTRVLRLLEAVVEEKFEEEDEKLAVYKDIEINRIPEALERVNWGTSVSQDAGELASCLILRHALPNANHRTSLGMLSLYYQAISPQFDMPATATADYDWEGWVNAYIEDSKKLITVRRNTLRFLYLNEVGCNVVERKDGLRIHLNEYELDMSPREALSYYATQHTQRSIEFAETVLAQAGTSELRNGSPLTKKEFAERLQEME